MAMLAQEGGRRWDEEIAHGSGGRTEPPSLKFDHRHLEVCPSLLMERSLPILTAVRDNLENCIGEFESEVVRSQPLHIPQEMEGKQGIASTRSKLDVPSGTCLTGNAQAQHLSPGKSLEDLHNMHLGGAF